MSSLYYDFATPSDKHNHILYELSLAFGQHRKEYLIFRENMGLVYKGERNSLDEHCLAAHNEYAIAELDTLSSVIPDFMVFAKNSYIYNKSRTKIAGQPLLIVEVWSKGNKKAERLHKQYLYSTSPNTEHWYLTQNSNKIECWLGENKIKSQSLAKPFTTTFGFQIDLSQISLAKRWF